MEKQNELYETIDKIAKASVLLYAVMESDGDKQAKIRWISQSD